MTEIAALIERGVFKPVNFFSYFTIECNIAVFLTLILSAVAVAANENDRLGVLRGAVTVYIGVVGIGFSVLLAGIEDATLTAVPWDNVVLHYVVPVAATLDYLVDRPAHRLSFKKSFIWLLFPITYVIYSLTRGRLTGWYPYPFLNPGAHGPAAVAGTVAGLLLLGLGLIWTATKLSGPRALA
ncbi:MAG: Pr6Pr family membrane protein [Aeromicrobium sp.]